MTRDEVYPTPHDVGRPRQEVGSFRRHALRYVWDDERRSFRHNVDRDVQVFVLWEAARPQQDAILDGIGRDFEILHCADVHWSEEHLARNFNRLYRTPLRATNHRPAKLGDGPFLAVVAEDPHPIYVYDRSVSGMIECTNRKVVEHKRRYRSWTGGYRVHSSNSLEEFFEQASLLFGPGRLREILAGGGSGTSIETLSSDLAGADGWADLPELFEVLRLTTDTMVLRNFEELPDDLVDPDVDLLCSDLVGFLSASNARADPRPHRRHRCTVVVDHRRIRIDARSVGDGYYDTSWQRDMLRRQCSHRGLIGRPRADDYFFSLLYHATVQKPAVTPEYAARLENLAKEIGLEWFTSDDARTAESAAAVLRGYMEAAGYRHVRPLDRRVHENRSIARNLPIPLRQERRWMARARWQARRVARGGVRRVRRVVERRWGQ